MKFHGSFVALPTPFRGGAVDHEALRGLVAFHLSAGTNGLVPCGTTGEAVVLSAREYREVIETVVAAADGRLPVIAGAGTNSTARAVELARMAREAGADGLLVVTPYYNKPPQDAMVEHFAAVSVAAGLPVCVYNVPGRTGVNLLPETVAELHHRGVAAAVKEASGNIAQVSRIIALTRGELPVMSGEDSAILPIMAVGGTGVISVAANVAPAAIATLVRCAAAGDLAAARRIQLGLLPLIDALFWESNPIPVKAALAHMGMIANELRLPLRPLQAHFEKALIEVMNKSELEPARTARQDGGE
ncbi:MAG: 4-hydroxy-tetrahydrodipicolinate synthase [Candidatus Schekmanbacteria bacterium]|nr:4-hydroxy-tetrahydrodipicolinate synthase [Candidatus Schekmanbacteria bacterium]